MNEANKPVAHEREAQPSNTDLSTNVPDAVNSGLCVMGGQMTRGEIAHAGVFRAGDRCEQGAVRPAGAVDLHNAETKGQ